MEELKKIRNLCRTINEFETKLEKEVGINFNEGLLLYNLEKNGRLSSGEISQLLELMLSNTSKIIKAAEHKGLINRILGNTDKRQMYFSLTPKGNETLKSLKKIEFSTQQFKELT
jgi:DNA-binding MarR family transcriptional regulator